MSEYALTFTTVEGIVLSEERLTEISVEELSKEQARMDTETIHVHEGPPRSCSLEEASFGPGCLSFKLLILENLIKTLRLEREEIQSTLLGSLRPFVSRNSRRFPTVEIVCAWRLLYERDLSNDEREREKEKAFNAMEYLDPEQVTRWPERASEVEWHGIREKAMRRLLTRLQTHLRNTSASDGLGC